MNTDFAFYVMGPSGSGKDTVMNAVREELGSQVCVPTRYITREQVAGEPEEHYAISAREYDKLLSHQHFSLHWQANDCQYAYDRHWLMDIGKKPFVLLNGSREYWSKAHRLFGAQLQPIQLFLDESTQRQRLENRQRESQDMIESRILRSHSLADTNVDRANQIDASQILDKVVADFIHILKSSKGMA